MMPSVLRSVVDVESALPERFHRRRERGFGHRSPRQVVGEVIGVEDPDVSFACQCEVPVSVLCRGDEIARRELHASARQDGCLRQVPSLPRTTLSVAALVVDHELNSFFTTELESAQGDAALGSVGRLLLLEQFGDHLQESHDADGLDRQSGVIDVHG